MERYQASCFTSSRVSLEIARQPKMCFRRHFFRFTSRPSSLILPGAFRPWLFTIAANKARDLIRSQARRPTNPFQASINPGDDESGEFMDDVIGGLIAR